MLVIGPYQVAADEDDDVGQDLEIGWDRKNTEHFIEFALSTLQAPSSPPSLTQTYCYSERVQAMKLSQPLNLVS